MEGCNTPTYGHRPPEIHHVPKRPSGYSNMAEDAAKNTHVTSGAAKLLALYADCSNGFSPTLKFISDRTGLAVEHINRQREQLNARGLIRYSEKEARIDVCWDVIRAAAIYGNIKDAKAESSRGTSRIARLKIKDLPIVSDVPEDDCYCLAELERRAGIPGPDP